ncbi:unnamed protein product, partial [Amoebophrya sp. A25]
PVGAEDQVERDEKSRQTSALVRDDHVKNLQSSSSSSTNTKRPLLLRQQRDLREEHDEQDHSFKRTYEQPLLCLWSVDEEERTPFMHLCSSDALAPVVAHVLRDERLFWRARVAAQDADGLTALHHAARNGCMQISALLMLGRVRADSCHHLWDGSLFRYPPRKKQRTMPMSPLAPV